MHSLRLIGATYRGYFPQDILDNFDLVGIDHRGNGLSELGFLFKLVFGKSDAHHRLNFNQIECNLSDISYFQETSTIYSVQDIELLRNVLLGKDGKVSILGYSAGSRVAGLYATVYPQHTRAIIIDSPTINSDYSLSSWEKRQSNAYYKNMLFNINKLKDLHLLENHKELIFLNELKKNLNSVNYRNIYI